MCFMSISTIKQNVLGRKSDFSLSVTILIACKICVRQIRENCVIFLFLLLHGKLRNSHALLLKIYHSNVYFLHMWNAFFLLHLSLVFYFGILRIWLYALDEKLWRTNFTRCFLLISHDIKQQLNSSVSCDKFLDSLVKYYYESFWTLHLLCLIEFIIFYQIFCYFWSLEWWLTVEKFTEVAATRKKRKISIEEICEGFFLRFKSLSRRFGGDCAVVMFL